MQRIKLLKLLNTTYFLKLNIHIGNDPKYTNLYINKFLYGNATNFVIFNIQRLFLELKKFYNIYDIIRKGHFLSKVLKKKKLLPIIYNNISKYSIILNNLNLSFNASIIYNKQLSEPLTNLKIYQYKLLAVKEKNSSYFSGDLLKNINNYSFLLLQKNLKKLTTNKLTPEVKTSLLSYFKKLNFLFAMLLDSTKSPLSVPYKLFGNIESLNSVYFYVKFFLKINNFKKYA